MQKWPIQRWPEYSQKWHNGTSSKARSTETFDRLAAIQAQLNNLGREIKKVNEKVYVAQVGCKLCKGLHYTKDCPLKEEGNTLEEAYYTQQTLEESLTRFMVESAKRHEENSNIIKEIRASTDAAIRNQEASIKTLEIQIGQMSKVLQERGIGGLLSSTEPNPRDHVKSISTTKADSSEIRRMGCGSYAVSSSQHKSTFSKTIPFPRRLHNYCCDDWREAQDVKILKAYDHTLPQKEKDPGSFTLPCFIHNVYFDKALVDLGASDKDDHERKSPAEALTDILVFVGKFSILTGLKEINDMIDDDPDDITDIFKIEGNLFDFETPLCEAFNDFNYLLKIDKDLVPYQLCDHICEPYRFKNEVTKWPTCSSDIDGFCNSGELPGMVRVGSMTYFQDHKWYDELADGRLKEETLMHKAKFKESWGNATPGWKINANEVAPFTRLESYGQRPYANIKTERAHNPYLEVNNIFDRNYDTSNAQDNQGHEERRDNPTFEPSVCKIRRFEMMKYSFSVDEEYIAIKESEYLNHSKDSLDAYR
ncbi:hypothetical protein Tco_1285340 [Tanacetum coccineum]